MARFVLQTFTNVCADRIIPLIMLKGQKALETTNLSFLMNGAVYSRMDQIKFVEHNL